MSTAYDELLDATIQHLENLKSRGVRHVPVAPETLRALAVPAKFQISNFKSQIPPAVAPSNAAPVPEPRSSRREEAQTFQPAFQAVVAEPVPQKSQSLLTSAVTDIGATPLDPQAKAAAFAALRERALACVKCPHLASSRKNVVFGVGNIDAQLMFVGEAPGADEDAQGEPFVGRAGELLTKIIQATGLKRGDVYIANILKCRPDKIGRAHV